MRILITDIMKKGSLFFLIFMLTACTGKEEVVLELDGQAVQNEKSADSENLSDREDLSDTEELSAAETQTNDVLSENLPGEIYVHICGAVVKPGVYKLTADSRAFEGIDAAGGFREDACADFINLAKSLQDGQRLVVPTMEEAEAAKENGAYQESWAVDADIPEQSAGTETTVGGTETDGRININTATASELTGINGIGETKAAAIIQYRQENGSFASVEDIMKVSGIGEGTYEKIKDKITIK